MWVAIAVTAELAAYFFVQASNALARREHELEKLRVHAARNERLASLTTLAAGPRTSCRRRWRPSRSRRANWSDRRPRRDTGPPGRIHGLTDDARLIRMEVDRCQEILDQMSGRAGGVAPDQSEPVDVRQIVRELRDRLPAELAARLDIRTHGDLPLLEVPRAGFGQVVASLVKNAFDATPGDVCRCRSM